MLAASQPKAATVHPDEPAPMRIGLLSQWYEPEPQNVPSLLAHELQARHHSVKVLTGFPNYPLGRLFDGYRISWRSEGLVSGVPVRRVALFPSHGQSRVGRLANYGTFAASAALWGTSWFRDVEALWVYNSPPTTGLPTWLTKARYRPRVILHMMDLWPESLTASGFGGSILKWSWLERGLDKWLSMTYDAADSIACTSRNQLELLVQRGVSRDKLSYVPIWVDESIFHPVPKDEMLAASLGVKDKTVLLYAGALGEAQGLDVLVDACEQLLDEPDFHCLIAGSGIAEARLRDQVSARQLTNISFLGRWPTSDMNRLMSVGDIHLASLRPDPLAEIAMPTKVLATLACAKPLIAALGGDAAAVVTGSGAGWACQPGNPRELESAIRSALAAGNSRLQKMGRRGRAAYEAEFAFDIGVARVEALLAGGIPVKSVAVLPSTEPAHRRRAPKVLSTEGAAAPRVAVVLGRESADGSHGGAS